MRGFTFGEHSRVVVAAELAGTEAAFAEDLCRPTAAAFAEDVHAPTAAAFAEDLRAPSTAVGDEPRPGDIELRLGGASLPAEGYRIAVGPSITIAAATEAGVFYGTRSVLQWLRRGRTVPGGTAVDWPSYPERGLMVDVGRKFFSPRWLYDRIREMGDLKLNYLHLHLSDRHGFRLQCDTHPEIVAARHYTKREIRDLVGYAARRHVQVVPEIDFPGHMDAILAGHPELRLAGTSGSIDLSKPAAYALICDLIAEFVPLFPSGYWHLGADEYVTDYADHPQLAEYARYGPEATAKDTYLGFVNWAAGIVCAAGKTARIPCSPTGRGCPVTSAPSSMCGATTRTPRPRTRSRPPSPPGCGSWPSTPGRPQTDVVRTILTSHHRGSRRHTRRRDEYEYLWLKSKDVSTGCRRRC